MKSIKERFLEKVEMEPSGCWVWKAQILDGSPRFYLKNKMHRANRIAWRLFYGFVPGRLKVLAKCNNKLCVNPNHLFVGTSKHSMQRYWSAK